MANNGTLKPSGAISGELSPTGSISGQLQQTQKIEGGITAPKTRPGADDYEKLKNHPYINDEEVIGHKTFEDYGDHTLSNLEIKAIFDRVFGG